MLNVYLDTNVLSQLSNGLYPEEKAEIERLKLDGTVAVYFNGCNLDELMCMIKDEQQFVKCRQILQFSRRLCSNNILLDDNWRHMQRSIAGYLQVNPPKLQFDSARIFSFIYSAKGYKEVSKDDGFLRFRDHIEEFKRDWARSARDTCDQIRAKLGITKRAEPKHPMATLLSQEPWLGLLRQRLWESCKGHHRVPDYADRLHHDVAYIHIPSVRYFIDLQKAYYERTWTEGTKPQESDYFDLEYVIYLDIMDYYVTNDKAQKTRYDRASQEIGCGCVLLTDITELRFLPARAPNRDRLRNMPFRIVKT